MPVEIPPQPCFRFGAFEVDVRSGELRKQGLRVKIQEQPFQLLMLLLRKPGEVVSREELRERIWHSDTFIDFDNGLNTSINRLREALGDSAANPRFIETLPRRGYRFIAPVSTVNFETASAHRRSTSETFRGTRLAASAVVILGVLLGIAWMLRWRAAPRLTEKDAIVLADFTNTTGDSVFDGTLCQGLAVQLEQSPFLRLVSEEQIQQTLRLMKQAPEAKLSPEIAREVCQRTNSTVALDGSIVQIGMRYSVIVKAVNCTNGESLASTEAEASNQSRGLAYLAAHQGSEAASEFQKILSHRGIVLNAPIGALAHLQIARAYAMQGDKPKAHAAYQDFLQLWRSADPEVPVLKQANAEYARLQHSN